MKSRGFKSFPRCFWPLGFSIINVRSKDVKFYKSAMTEIDRKLCTIAKKEKALFET